MEKIKGLLLGKKYIVISGVLLALLMVINGYFYLKPEILMYKKQLLICMFISAFTALVFCLKVSIKEKTANILFELCLWGSAAIMYFVMADMNGYRYGINFKYGILNVLLIYALYRLALCVVWKGSVAVLIVNVLLYIMALGNHYFYIFKESVVLPWDLMNIGTGLAVAEGYEYEPYTEGLLGFLILLLITTVFFKLKPKMVFKRRILYSVVSLLLGLAIIFSIRSSSTYKKMSVTLYNTGTVYRSQGICLGFMRYCSLLEPKVPAGYTHSEVENIAADYEALPEPEAAVRAKNIIVLMNESFCDFSAYSGEPIPEMQEALSFYENLTENTIRGNLYVSTYGAGTVNAEYEFLTGNSMVYQEGYPFSYKVRKERPSLPDLLEQEGMQVQAMHLAKRGNWSRDRVYPYLSIEDFISIESVADEDPDIIEIEDSDNEKGDALGGRVTDDWDVDKVISLYENKTSEGYFLFNVTIQNHGGYSQDAGWTDSYVTCDLSEYGDYPEDEVYISLLKKSDDAFKKLVEYFEKVEEPTLICMFGDHQPETNSDLNEVLYGKNFETPLEISKKYVTDFCIWTNYDIEEKRFEELSSNYLGGLVLETAGIPLPPYYKLLKVMREKYPVFSKYLIMDKNGEVKTLEEAEKDSVVRQYQMLEYNSSDDTDVCWEAFR